VSRSPTCILGRERHRARDSATPSVLTVRLAAGRARSGPAVGEQWTSAGTSRHRPGRTVRALTLTRSARARARVIVKAAHRLGLWFEPAPGPLVEAPNTVTVAGSGGSQRGRWGAQAMQIDRCHRVSRHAGEKSSSSEAWVATSQTNWVTSTTARDRRTRQVEWSQDRPSRSRNSRAKVMPSPPIFSFFLFPPLSLFFSSFITIHHWAA